MNAKVREFITVLWEALPRDCDCGNKYGLASFRDSLLECPTCHTRITLVVTTTRPHEIKFIRQPAHVR